MSDTPITEDQGRPEVDVARAAHAQGIAPPPARAVDAAALVLCREVLAELPEIAAVLPHAPAAADDGPAE